MGSGVIPRSWIIGAALAGLVASNGYSFTRGKLWGQSIEKARNDAAVKALEVSLRTVTNRVIGAEEARLAIERERNDLLADLDAQGLEDPDAGRRSLGADSVRRINSIGR